MHGNIFAPSQFLKGEWQFGKKSFALLDPATLLKFSLDSLYLHS